MPEDIAEATGPDAGAYPSEKSGVEMDGQVDYLDLTIGWLVKNRDVSVRLANCVAASRPIRETTLRQCLADPERTRRSLLGVPNLGRTTAREFFTLVEAFAGEPQADRRRLVDIQEAGEEIAFRVLVDLLTPIPFPAALLTIETSARLRNCLKTIASSGLTPESKEVDVADLGAVLAGWPGFRRQLSKQANLGRTTIAELASIIEKIVIMRLNAGRGSDNAFPALSMDDLMDRRLDASVVEMLLKLRHELREQPSRSEPTDVFVLLHGADRDTGLSPLEQVHAVVSRLPNNERDVIRRRYGMDDRPAETLEEVGVHFHVTRERVRQVEAKALARLRVGANRRAFERLLEAEGETIWGLLSDGSDLLLPADLQDRRAAVAKEHLLAIDVAYGRVVDWLASRGRPGLGGWLRGSVDPEDVRRSAKRLADWAAAAPGPVPVAAISKVTGVPVEHIGTAMKLRPDIRIFENYLCPGHLGSQARRTCRLHKLALNLGESLPFDIATLQSKYALAFPDDEVAPRVVLLQMQRAPHLFFRLFDGIWMAFGSGTPGDGNKTFADVPFERGFAVGANDPELGGIGAWLHAVLAGNGPMRAVDLRAMAETGLPQKISQSSVGAVLQSNGDFVRLGPGVYGLQQHVPVLSDPLVPISPAMLSDAQCRYYATSRMAGDPLGLYPAWSYGLESALCRWASANGTDENYRSMLAVSDPSKWRLAPDEEAAWQNRKREHGSFRLPRLNPPQALRLPSAAAFLSAAIYLGMTGSIAWTTVNRTAQRRIDDQKAASTLAILVRFGMAVQPSDWQERYLSSPQASAVVSHIMADLAKRGALSWDEGALAAMRREPPVAEARFFDARQVEAMLAGGEAVAESGRMMDGGKPIDVESLFGSDEWGAAFLSNES